MPRLAHDVLTGRYFGDDAPSGPLDLADITIFLPTRRACRELRDVFFDVKGDAATLLPAIIPIGDPDDDEDEIDPAVPIDQNDGLKAMGGLERQLFLTQLIMAWGETQKGQRLDLAGVEMRIIPSSPANATALARSLMALLDEVTSDSDVDFSALTDLVPEQYSDYFALSLDFLKIITQWWPERLKERQAIDVIDLRNRRILKRADRVAQGLFPGPVIAAGSTGSIPATARLIAQIATSEKGAVVLPGVDRIMADREWDALLSEGAVSHPQYGLAQLLQSLAAIRDEIKTSDGHHPSSDTFAREALVGEAMRAADATAEWGTLTHRLRREDLEKSLANVSIIEAANERDEALSIALIMRRALDNTQGKTVLITPDRALARRVSGELRRWNIRVDDSAGVPLIETGPIVLTRLLIDAVTDRFAPVSLLALMKHPLFRVGKDPAHVRQAVRSIELELLRGPRPGIGLDGLQTACKRRDDLPDKAASLVADLSRILAPLERFGDEVGQRFPFRALLEVVFQAVSQLSQDAQGQNLVFMQEAGEAFASFLKEAFDSSSPPLEIAWPEFHGLLIGLLAGRSVKPIAYAHPRLHIWGPLEARLQSAEQVILGGLNEGTWPQLPDVDPWLSRPMRKDMGLEAPERRISLAAHDFQMALGAPTVVLSRALKVDGAPSVPSRWVQRLKAVAEGLDLALQPAMIDGQSVSSLSRSLDHAPFESLPPPAPKPPRALRPTSMSVTRIEDWVRDPYTVYAKLILRLKKLDPIDQPPDASDRGSIIHEALSAFMTSLDVSKPLDRDAAMASLVGFGESAFAQISQEPQVEAVWWPRFCRVAEWFVDNLASRIENIDTVICETDGALDVFVDGDPFTLTARADRIDLLCAGSAHIIDYKTGVPPTGAQVFSGLTPQLTLEAAILRDGGFRHDNKHVQTMPSGMSYLRLSGGDPAGEWRHIDKKDKKPVDLNVEIDKALGGLTHRIRRYRLPDTPYAPMRIPQYRSRYGDYDHLARIRDWALTGESEEP